MGAGRRGLRWPPAGGVRGPWLQQAPLPSGLLQLSPFPPPSLGGLDQTPNLKGSLSSVRISVLALNLLCDQRSVDRVLTPGPEVQEEPAWVWQELRPLKTTGEGAVEGVVFYCNIKISGRVT